MKAILDELHAIVGDARTRGIPVAVIGACALRTYLSDPDRRVSVDADLVTTNAGIEPCALFRRLAKGRRPLR